MNDDIDLQNTDFADDEKAQITDLDPPGQLWQRRFVQVNRLVHKSLARPWIRYGLSGTLALVLLGALALQWLRPAFPPLNGAHPSFPSFLSLVSARGLFFIQTTDHRLTA